MADTIIRDMASFIKAFKAAPTDHQEVILKDLEITHPGLAALLKNQYKQSATLYSTADIRAAKMAQEENNQFKKAA